MPHRSRTTAAMAVLVGALLCAPPTATAQSHAPVPSPDGPTSPAVSEPSGTLVDASGAAVPFATILISQEGSTAIAERIRSSRDGSFVLPQLEQGRYRLTVSVEGFATRAQLVDLPLREPLRLVLEPAAFVEHVSVVSASRQEELRESLNTRVDVVTRGRIEESGGHATVGELLREIPGVVTRRGSQTAGPAGEQIQGIDSRQVLVLLDGQPLVGARGIKRGGVLDLDRQSSARLDRIEVVKGAASALYGSEALGGVINLITREPSAPFDLTVSAAGGSFGAADVRLDSGYRRDRTFGFFSIERHQHDGFDLTPTTIDTTGAPFRRHDAMARLHGQLSPSVAIAGFATGYHNHTGGRSIGELGPQEDDVTDRALSTNAASTWIVGAGTTVQARAYASGYSERTRGRLANPASTPLDPGALDERYVKGDVSLAHPIGSRQLLQAGFEWSHDRYEGTNRLRDGGDGHEADTLVGWVQHRWSLADRLTTTAGLRVDRREPYETAVSPKIGLSLRLTDRVHARASFGRGFRAPDLGQLYYRFLAPSIFYQVIGNPNLDPETARSWQGGVEFMARRRRARLGVNVFRNDVRNLIESVNLGFVATPQQLADLLAREGLDPSFRPVLGRMLLTYRNLVDVVTQGVEADAEAAMASSFSVGGAWTYLSAEDRDTGQRLTGRHRHQGHVRLSWRPREAGLTASLRGTFFSSWIVTRASSGNGGTVETVAPRFALWDLHVTQRLPRGLSAYFAVENLSDSQDPNTGVVLPGGTPAPIHRPDAGRELRVGLQWSFAAR